MVSGVWLESWWHFAFVSLRVEGLLPAWKSLDINTVGPQAIFSELLCFIRRRMMAMMIIHSISYY